MTKYKIVGILNFLLGIPLLLTSLIFAIFTIPRLSQLYKDMNVNISGNITRSYILVLIVLTFAITNLFLGIKGFSNTKKKDIYYKYGFIAVVITFLLSGFIVAIMTLSAIYTIYNVTSQF